MKCFYCENEATKKDYRAWDGITGKVIVCDECFNLSNEGILDREAQMAKAFKEYFNLDEVDTILNIAMDKFWDCVNEEVLQYSIDWDEAFKLATGIYAHGTSVDKWKESMYEKITETLKAQL